MQLGKISSADLSILLTYVPLLFKEEQEARELLQQNAAEILAPGHLNPSWCHWYELSAPAHFAQAMLDVGGGHVLHELSLSSNQLRVMPTLIAKANADINAWEPTTEQEQALRESLPVIFGVLTSITNSLRSLMIFGCYLNELIAKVRCGGKDADTSMLSAIKIDPTVLGCPSVIARMSSAVMLDEKIFLADVRKALAGNFSKREQKTYEDMRFVLQVLHETGAPRLGANDLYTLFYEELNLVRNEAGDGDVKNNLRQFAYQFMKQKAVS